MFHFTLALLRVALQCRADSRALFCGSAFGLHQPSGRATISRLHSRDGVLTTRLVLQLIDGDDARATLGHGSNLIKAHAGTHVVGWPLHRGRADVGPQ